MGVLVAGDINLKVILTLDAVGATAGLRSGRGRERVLDRLPSDALVTGVLRQKDLRGMPVGAVLGPDGYDALPVAVSAVSAFMYMGRFVAIRTKGGR